MNEINSNDQVQENESANVNKENLPVVQKGRLAMLADNLRNSPKTADTLRRIGKIVGYGSLGITSFAVGVGLSGITATIAGALSVIGAAGTVIHSSGKVDKDMMFAIKGNGEIGHTLRPDLIMRVSQLTKEEKTAYMGLQAITALSRVQRDLQGTSFTQDEKGNKIFDKKFTTRTHSDNKAVFEALRKVGYIVVDSVEPDTRMPNRWERKAGITEPVQKDSALLIEKMLIGNWKGIGEHVGNVVQNGVRKIPLLGKRIVKQPKVYDKRAMENFSFRITDKPLNVEELYYNLNDKKFREENKEYKDLILILGKFCPFNTKKHRSIKMDIKKDRFGREFLKFVPSNTEENTIEVRCKAEIALREKKAEFEKRTKVDNEGIEEKALEELEAEKNRQDKTSEKSDEGR